MIIILIQLQPLLPTTTILLIVIILIIIVMKVIITKVIHINKYFGSRKQILNLYQNISSKMAYLTVSAHELIVAFPF